MVRRAGGPGDVPETNNEPARKHCPEDLHENFWCVSSCKSLWRVRQTLHWFKRSARACRRVDLPGLCNMASLIRSILSGTGAENGRPSWRHLDIHKSRVLRLGASRFGNCYRKPRLCFDKQFHCRNWMLHWPCQLNSKHHCTWWWSKRKRRLAGTLVLEFKKTVRCLWRTLYKECK
jgi:hypothetical protein